jgi:hypothetical protein
MVSLMISFSLLPLGNISEINPMLEGNKKGQVSRKYRTDLAFTAQA